MSGPHLLVPGSQNPIASAIRRAIGASDDEPVQFCTPLFDRPAGWPSPAAAPSGFAEFSNLFRMSADKLKALGLGNWDGGLFLFPHEWYEFIPRGFPCEDIMGYVEPFEHGKSDDDKRAGCLSYGVRIGQATDGDE